MSRAASLLAVLALVAAPAAAQDAPKQGHVWHGTLGNEAITACFEEEFIRDGIYYVDAALEPIRLAEVEGTDPPSFLEVSGEETVDEATWIVKARSDDRLEGVWRKGEETQPIALRATAIDLPEYGSACETDAFLDPLLAGGTVTSAPARFGKTAFTALTYKGPDRAGLSDYTVLSLALDPVRPGDGAINAALAKALPDGTATHEMGQCVGMSLGGGMGGYSEDSLVPVLLTPRWLGIRKSGDGYCGGAHPSSYIAFAVYDRDSGAEVDPATWFTPGALEFYEFVEPDPAEAKRPIANFSKALAKAVRARWPRAGDDDCDLPDKLEGIGWDIGLTREGPVFVPQFPHVMFACTEEVVLPWKAARPFLSKEGKAVMASLR